MPGVGGNKIQAKLDNRYASWYCWSTTTEYYDIWLDPAQFLYPFINCWAANMKLTYNNLTRQTTNQPGVSTKIPGYPVNSLKHPNSNRILTQIFRIRSDSEQRPWNGLIQHGWFKTTTTANTTMQSSMLWVTVAMIVSRIFSEPRMTSEKDQVIRIYLNNFITSIVSFA